MYVDVFLQVYGLPDVSTAQEVYEMEIAMYNLFAEHVPEAVNVVPCKGMCYVRVSHSLRYVHIHG
jgi:hypothetical protein